MSYDDFGESKTYDLLPNGADVGVTAENRHEYVRLYTKCNLLEDSNLPRTFLEPSRSLV